MGKKFRKLLIFGVPSKYLSNLDIVSWNLSPLQLHPHNLAESSNNSRREDAVFVQPTHFLVEAGREPQGAEHPLLRPCQSGLARGISALLHWSCSEGFVSSWVYMCL